MNSNTFYERPSNQKVGDGENNIKWYTKTGWIIVLLIFFFPVGIYLMWKYAKWNNIVKGVISGFFALCFLSKLLNPTPKETVVTEVQTTIESTVETSVIEFTSTTEEITTSEIETESEIIEETSIEQPIQNTVQETVIEEPVEEEVTEKVWIASSSKGKKYHKDPSCSGMVAPDEITLEKAISLNLTPCDKCCN